jgi:serine/threonine protein kinase
MGPTAEQTTRGLLFCRILAVSTTPDDPTCGPSPTRAASSTVGVRAPTVNDRFAPGAIVAGRYRLVALLGKGGMGEVYRADDLTLDQPVALKFLPADATDVASSDSHARLAQFHNELRIARQVSHKNVCRLYDLGEADGRRFLTMEYVDGEDLGALLKRIGRFPQDRALEIARQVCAGVAAAHEKGVIHRDLKPANVMIDGEGHVRITDFGIATATADADGAVVGTPQYMAPEQLTGRSASVSTDIYALGLVLFEIFTGKRAHNAKSIADLRAIHDTGTITTPSSIVHDLAPAVERVILRCLERDPRRRPGSALAVAASLPGGNPLAEALAAGETPSPDLLAAAAETSAISVWLGVSLVTASLVILSAYIALSSTTNQAAFDMLEKPPEVLADRAEQIFASVGLTGEVGDRAYNFDSLGAYINWIERTDRSPGRWEQLRLSRPGGIGFWYRTSPNDLVPFNAVGGVTYTDPPEVRTGMRSVALDTHGRLRTLTAVPLQLDKSPASGEPPNWKPLFDAAGLDIAAFHPVTPEWTPPSFADTRAAWEGAYPERQDIPIRIEAAAYHSKPVWFYSIGPWTVPLRAFTATRTKAQTILAALDLTAWVGVLAGAAILARRNVRLNRADTRAATRLAVWLIATFSLGFVVLDHHTANPATEVNKFFVNLGFGMYLGGTLWVMYLAIEPYARRTWPDGLLGWTRLLAGHLRDPRVGKDLLIGIAFGCLDSFIEAFRIAAIPKLGLPPPRPELGAWLSLLLGPGRLAGQLSNWTYGPMENALFIALTFVGLRFLLKNDWLALSSGLLLLLTIGDGGAAVANGIGWMTVFYLLLYLPIYLALLRFGLLVVVVALVVDSMLTNVPIPMQFSTWAAAPFEWTVICVLALMSFGYYAARAGQPLLGGATSE